MQLHMIHSTEDVGQMIRLVRKQLNVTQSDLALAAGTGLRFIVDLEKGKPTCQIGKVFQVLQVLGIQCDLSHTEVKSLES
ncbi:MAG: helix-turn-helix transcriptional regulator [Legionellaceae bacterium]|nr:helix-turn-helix transcriptional regulator [Legionellaceae bacterium]